MLPFALLLMPLLSQKPLAQLPSSVAESQGSNALALKGGDASINPQQAKRLSPRALGEVLLSGSDLPVVEATVGPQGLEPPPPPGPPSPMRVKLYFRPTPSAEPGFCQQLVATTFLKPFTSPVNGTASSWRAEGLSTELAYRWADGDTPTANSCSAPRTDFFTPEPRDTRQILQVIRLLAWASTAAKARRPLPFPLTIEDRLGPEMLDYLQKHPELSPIPDMKVITDAREALAALPINAVTFAGPASRSYPNIIKESDLHTPGNHLTQAVTIFLGGEWTVGLVLDQARITRMRLLRATPAPF